LPWIALILALTFGLYGLLRKTAKLDSLEGLSLETILFFLPAAGYLVYLAYDGRGAFLTQGPFVSTMLPMAGLVTALPLLLFAVSARRITLTTLGILQYVAPTLQFLCGVLIYGEPMSAHRLIGFVVIWTALVIYTVGSRR
jgi:chloramphenicol-sensitive protein RarD